MNTRRATAIGCCAVLLWSTLGLFTAMSGKVPPFQLVAMSFVVAGLIGVRYLVRSGSSLAALAKVPPGAWALGIAGLFGYHFFYFLALRSAPPVEANLINYLWPLLIVLFSALLKEEGGSGGLKWWHVLGAVLGLAGTALIVAGGPQGTEGQVAVQGHWVGYASGIAAALVWSSYSVANRRYANVASTSVTGFCFATAALACLAHLAFEQTIWPATPLEWMAALGLGLGPVGAAFYVWDYGTKHGDIRVLGAAAYAAPLLSTLLLILFGISQATPQLWIACLLITGGAVLAAKEMLFSKSS